MYKLVKKHNPKVKTIILEVDHHKVLRPSTQLKVGVIKDREDKYYEELDAKLKTADPDFLNTIQAFYRASSEVKEVFIHTRDGDWVRNGLAQFLRDKTIPFYMSLGLPLTEEEKIMNDIKFD